MVEDYRPTALSLRAHPAALLRGELAAPKIRPCSKLATIKPRDFR